MEDEKKSPQVTVGGIVFDVKFSVIVALSVLLPTILHYHRITSWLLGSQFSHFTGALAYEYDQLLLFFFVPLLVILIGFWESPTRYGFRVGKWREGLVWMAIVCPIMLVILWFLVRNSDMQEFYIRGFYGQTIRTSHFIQGGAIPSQAAHGHLYMIWMSILAIVPWEFLWRGFYLFGLARITGAGPAIFLQAVPFALLHLGKPEVETITTIFGGVGFGFIAWRTQSFLYAMLIHLFILLATNLIAYGSLG